MPISVLAIDIGDSELLSFLQERRYTLHQRQIGQLFVGSTSIPKHTEEYSGYALALLDPTLSDTTLDWEVHTTRVHTSL